MDLGSVMLAIDKYKKSEVSIGTAAKIAGVSNSRMMDLCMFVLSVVSGILMKPELKKSRR